LGTAIGLDGEVQYQTPVHGLPLPPPIPGRFVPVYNGNGQYRLPDPDTGALTSYTRASTIAKTLEDTAFLDMWSKRMMLLGMWTSPDLYQRVAELGTGWIAKNPGVLLGPATVSDLKPQLNGISAEAQDRAGATYAAEFGTAVHDWSEWVDAGYGLIGQVPEMFRQWVRNHRRTLADSCLSVAPGYTERIVLNTRYGIAGTLDRLYIDHTGRWYLGDIKTSKGLDFSWLYFCIQLAIYHSASHVLAEDGSHWEPMPELDKDTALISHLPSVDADAARIVPLSMEFGAKALHTAMVVRRHRSKAAEYAQNVRYVVASESTTRRYYEARHLVETSETAEQLAAVWDEYQDVWNDALTTLGQDVLRLATQKANATP
jgi:hypothetical protein